MFAAILLSAACAFPDTTHPIRTPAVPSTDTPVLTAKQALQPFGVLVGTWKGSGAPEGPKEDRLAGAWEEKIAWEWQFKGEDTALVATFTKGKHFTKGELRYTPEKGAAQPRFTLVLTRTDKTTAKYVGTLDEKGKVLTLTRIDGPASTEERLVFSLLHHNRHLYRAESRPANSTVAFTKQYQVGATKEGVAFADVPKGPECIVSGGTASMAVTYKGKTYYVCCSGCRDEFRENPEKYIKEYEEKLKGKNP